MTEEVTTYSNSDWAGCEETRKSSSAGVVLIGNSHVESLHTPAKDHCEKQRRARIVRSIVERIRVKRGSVVAV